MRCANFKSSVFVSFGKPVKEDISQKYVKAYQNVKKQNSVIKDILGAEKSSVQEMVANMERNVPTTTMKILMR